MRRHATPLLRASELLFEFVDKKSFRAETFHVKVTGTIVLSILSLVLSLHAEDAKAVAPVQNPSIRIPTQTEKKDSQTPSDSFKKLPYTNAGLLVDIRRSTNRFRMFSLRQRGNPVADDENLIRDVSAPTRIIGVKLLSFDF